MTDRHSAGGGREEEEDGSCFDVEIDGKEEIHQSTVRPRKDKNGIHCQHNADLVVKPIRGDTIRGKNILYVVVV